MGCGNSKLTPEGEVVPPRIRPLLRRRFLEIRKRRNENALKDDGLSKKELLKDGDEEDDNSSEILDRKSTSSSSSSSSEKMENPLGKTDCNEQEDKKNVEIGSSLKKENVKEGKNDKPTTGEEEDDGAGDEEDRWICPGSPSFRVYFLEAKENEKKKSAEEEEEEKSKRVSMAGGEEEEDESSEKKRQSDDSFGSTASTASNGEQERKTSKKGKRGRALRRAIRKGGPVAVKNLLNVKSCYHPGGSGHDRASLLEGKTAAA